MKITEDSIYNDFGLVMGPSPYNGGDIVVSLNGLTWLYTDSDNIEDALFEVGDELESRFMIISDAEYNPAIPIEAHKAINEIISKHGSAFSGQIQCMVDLLVKYYKETARKMPNLVSVICNENKGTVVMKLLDGKNRVINIEFLSRDKFVFVEKWDGSYINKDLSSIDYVFIDSLESILS